MSHQVIALLITVWVYQGKTQMRASYMRFDTDTIEDSQWFTPVEFTEFLRNWRAGKLLGSFAIGHVLAEDAELQFINKE